MEKTCIRSGGSLKSNFKIHTPEEVEFTLTVRATVKEWKGLAVCLDAGSNHVYGYCQISYDFMRAIQDMVDSMVEDYKPEEVEVEEPNDT